MSSNLPPGCGRLPGEEDDGVTDLQEAVLGFLEDETMLPSVLNDQIVELVMFHERQDGIDHSDYRHALVTHLRAMAGKLARQAPTLPSTGK